jgi:glycosyltransferase involved in cell wall biosynthesis
MAEGERCRRLVIVVRADPVICGHAGEARNLAEAALASGIEDVRIVSWPIEAVEAAGLPLKPRHSILPYSPGIVVERPEPVGDYKVPDGRFTTGLVGRLVELFCDGVPTVCLSLYLLPHATVVAEALGAARATGLPVRVTTMAEVVGSDLTNVVRSCVEERRFGAAAYLFATLLGNDHCVAVSAFTRQLIIDAAATVDAALGTAFAPQCEARVRVSYPAIDAGAFRDLEPAAIDAALARRGLERNRYVLFLSRLTPAKGADDLIDGFRLASARHRVQLVIAGAGPAQATLVARAAGSAGAGGRIEFLDDVDDAEKPMLMAGCAAYVLPSKPRPEFVETFGIALAEKALAGGGPAITTLTGGIPEAVGDSAIDVPVGDPAAIGRAIDWVVLDCSNHEREARARKARAHARQFDRSTVFRRLMEGVSVPSSPDGPSAPLRAGLRSGTRA